MALGRRRALLIGAVGVAAAAAGALAGLGLRRSANGSAALQAAEFTDLKGRTRRLAEWKGKVVLCNFWATWCSPCREEIPMLVALSREMASKEVQVVGIALDSTPKVGEFARDYKVSYPLLLAGPDGIDLMRAVGNQVGGLPYTVFLDRQGRIVNRKLGALKEAEVRGRLAEMLRA
ncbi:MAG: TlpA family protein disulfide reductase [Candidatus Binataceae bacterium]|nr:TlpA family protein disulfide reductase [Candidatus Binataceae bacterium]